MNKTNIEFCDFTWNPIVGCSIGCEYCWARKFNYRFNKESNFSWPAFHPQRLAEPYKVKKPSKIFVCSMGDIFSPGVSPNWVEQVLKVVRENPQHTFQFLSKLPTGYKNFEFPPNVWIGTSIESKLQAGRISSLTSCGCKYITFALVEPLLGPVDGVDFSKIDFLFVGALTGPGSTAPDPEWIRSIKHHNIIWKENIKKYL